MPPPKHEYKTCTAVSAMRDLLNDIQRKASVFEEHRALCMARARESSLESTAIGSTRWMVDRLLDLAELCTVAAQQSIQATGILDAEPPTCKPESVGVSLAMDEDDDVVWVKDEPAWMLGDPFAPAEEKRKPATKATPESATSRRRQGSVPQSTPPTRLQTILPPSSLGPHRVKMAKVDASPYHRTAARGPVAAAASSSSTWTGAAARSPGPLVTPTPRKPQFARRSMTHLEEDADLEPAASSAGPSIPTLESSTPTAGPSGPRWFARRGRGGGGGYYLNAPPPRPVSSSSASIGYWVPAKPRRSANSWRKN